MNVLVKNDIPTENIYFFRQHDFSNEEDSEMEDVKVRNSSYYKIIFLVN